MSDNVAGTAGYAENAAQLIEQWERMPFAEAHSDVARLLPEAPVLILDVGAGSGRDAAAPAGMGQTIIAVEPVDELRNFGSMRHSSSRIEWVDDSLPDLNVVGLMNLAFDVPMLTAVWMRSVSAGCAARSSLLLDGGHVLMTIRHGPVPAGRRMFEVTDEEPVELAADCGLHCGTATRPVPSKSRIETKVSPGRVSHSDETEAGISVTGSVVPRHLFDLTCCSADFNVRAVVIPVSPGRAFFFRSEAICRLFGHASHTR